MKLDPITAAIVSSFVADARDCNRWVIVMKQRGAHDRVAQYRYRRDRALRDARRAMEG